MPEHGKWHNIQGRENVQDTKRGEVFQKLSREVYMTVKTGGSDSSMNPTLWPIVDRAKATNTPNDNVKRVIKKATNVVDETSYDEIMYEGYDPGGVRILVHALTDNRSRTATNVRMAFTRDDGSPRKTGSVGRLFDHRGYIVIERDGLTIDEETIFEDILEAGAGDLQTSPEVFEIYTAPEDFAVVRDELEREFTLVQAELTVIPQTTIDLDEEQREQLERLADKLGGDDDVSGVFTVVEM